MNKLNEFLAEAISFTEWPMFVLLIGGGLFLVIYSRFLPYRYFKHALDITKGKYDDKHAQGDVSSLQALSAAVAATGFWGDGAQGAIAPPLTFSLQWKILIWLLNIKGCK